MNRYLTQNFSSYINPEKLVGKKLANNFDDNIEID